MYDERIGSSFRSMWNTKYTRDNVQQTIHAMDHPLSHKFNQICLFVICFLSIFQVYLPSLSLHVYISSFPSSLSTFIHTDFLFVSFILFYCFFPFCFRSIPLIAEILDHKKNPMKHSKSQNTVCIKYITYLWNSWFILQFWHYVFSTLLAGVFAFIFMLIFWITNMFR